MRLHGDEGLERFLDDGFPGLAACEPPGLCDQIIREVDVGQRYDFRKSSRTGWKASASLSEALSSWMA